MSDQENRAVLEGRDIGLYAACVLIWGSTWLVITFQLGVVPPSVSVVWRFALSAVILLAFARFKRLNLRFSATEHFWIALQGASMFSLNYVLIYLAEQYLASGLVAVIFSLFVAFNIIGMRLFFGAPIRRTGVLGSMLGIQDGYSISISTGRGTIIERATP